MARIQILHLPPYGTDGEQPFALIVDQCETPPQRVVTGLDAGSDSLAFMPIRRADIGPAVEFTDPWQKFGQEIGARSVMVTPERVDIAGDESSGDVSIEFDHAALLATVSAAVRAHLEATPEHHFNFAAPAIDAKRLGKLAEEREKRQRGGR